MSFSPYNSVIKDTIQYDAIDKERMEINNRHSQNHDIHKIPQRNRYHESGSNSFIMQPELYQGTIHSDPNILENKLNGMVGSKRLKYPQNSENSLDTQVS